VKELARVFLEMGSRPHRLHPSEVWISIEPPVEIGRSYWLIW
jgi:hypothetical protein